MVFEEGKSIGVMGSYNRIGLTEAAGHYGLMTEVLRGEWGFKGCVLSDMAHPGNGAVNYDCYESINLRMLAGNNTQLTTSGTFEADIDTQWSSSAWGGKGAVVLKNDTSTIAWSMWYAMRELTKGYMYMAVQSTGFNGQGITKVAEGDEKVIEAELGEFSYTVAKQGATQYRLNQRVELPEGFTFNENGVLSGEFKHVGLYRVDIIATVGSSKAGIKLIINVSPAESEYDETIMTRVVDNQKGCAGGCNSNIGSATAIIGLVALAGIGFGLISLLRRRKEQ